CGFIGSNYVRHLLATRTSATAVVLDKLTYAGHRPNLQAEEAEGRCEVVVGDIADAALVTRLLEKHRPVSIVNFAAESHVDRLIDEPSPFLHTNVTGTFTLLEATRRYLAIANAPAKSLFRFVHLSTDEVHGSLEPSDPPFRETSTFAPNSPYAASKAAADHLCRAYFRTYGIPTVVLRPSNNYGPYQFPEKLIPLAVLRAIAGERIPVYGDGKQVRDWLHVEDTARAVEAARQAGQAGEAYQVGADEEQDNLAVLGGICDLLDQMQPRAGGKPYRELMETVTDRPGHDRRYATDAAKFKSHLSWIPRVSFADGLRKTVRWYLDNPAWCKSVQAKGYTGQRLGLSSGKG
ncbi:MAG: dTDP-glucose 4,6-dehydratase, partial [Verrucomicrobia bacterium]|nr:dTDP-glucose 4,6-dehydratase [Verrucomicrobiota bacterium]